MLRGLQGGARWDGTGGGGWRGEDGTKVLQVTVQVKRQNIICCLKKGTRGTYCTEGEVQRVWNRGGPVENGQQNAEPSHWAPTGEGGRAERRRKEKTRPRGRRSRAADAALQPARSAVRTRSSGPEMLSGPLFFE